MRKYSSSQTEGLKSPVVSKKGQIRCGLHKPKLLKSHITVAESWLGSPTSQGGDTQNLCLRRTQFKPLIKGVPEGTRLP